MWMRDILQVMLMDMYFVPENMPDNILSEFFTMSTVIDPKTGKLIYTVIGDVNSPKLSVLNSKWNNKFLALQNGRLTRTLADEICTVVAVGYKENPTNINCYPVPPPFSSATPDRYPSSSCDFTWQWTQVQRSGMVDVDTGKSHWMDGDIPGTVV